jgi:hypothetical protein
VSESAQNSPQLLGKAEFHERVPALSQSRLEERPNSFDYIKYVAAGGNLFFLLVLQ